MELDTLRIDLHYLPCLAYFTQVLAYEEIALIMYERYQKQSYHNRCYILSAQQVDRLTVPVLGGKKQASYASMQIDHQPKWAQTHWRSICTSYGKAPYFEYMAPYFEPILLGQHTYLHELSLALFTQCLDLLQIKKTITLETKAPATAAEGVYAVHHIHPRKESTLSHSYHPVAYQQVFGSEFIGNLSIIDLLFCKGPEACAVLQASRKTNVGIRYHLSSGVACMPGCISGQSRSLLWATCCRDVTGLPWHPFEDCK